MHSLFTAKLLVLIILINAILTPYIVLSIPDIIVSYMVVDLGDVYDYGTVFTIDDKVVIPFFSVNRYYSGLIVEVDIGSMGYYKTFIANYTPFFAVPLNNTYYLVLANSKEKPNIVYCLVVKRGGVTEPVYVSRVINLSYTLITSRYIVYGDSILFTLHDGLNASLVNITLTNNWFEIHIVRGLPNILAPPTIYNDTVVWGYFIVVNNTIVSRIDKVFEKFGSINMFITEEEAFNNYIAYIVMDAYSEENLTYLYI